MPVGIPRRLSSATASSRARGFGVCGSVARHAFSSSVGTDRHALTCVRSATWHSRSASRSTSGDFVRIEHGFAKSRIASQIPRISLYRPSTHWYGSVFVPIAMCPPAHDGRASSARSTSGTLTLTMISRSKSRPALKSRYSCVGRAKQ